MIYAFTTTTPDGPFSIVTSEEAVLASGWTDDIASLIALIHGDLRPRLEEVTTVSDPNGGALATAVAALNAYYAGDSSLLARVPVQQRSGPFREHAWDVLRTVAPGEVITYTEYANRSGRPSAVRAAASACAMNAAALFVPCHRVQRTDGTLGGFRYGLPVKESLLARERTQEVYKRSESGNL
ncbi:methylated-DNA--[protein]-cysteine S-methyltransferase [Populibacterium corticicola]|uniref:Methylated-DNA--[protein]-cysteine S-methyltransferase n=1 Tax=Populibacterium corticicola TaxID=1812826 RepID=A0ABW5XEU9_9MICO